MLVALEPLGGTWTVTFDDETHQALGRAWFGFAQHLEGEAARHFGSGGDQSRFVHTDLIV